MENQTQAAKIYCRYCDQEIRMHDGLWVAVHPTLASAYCSKRNEKLHIPLTQPEVPVKSGDPTLGFEVLVKLHSLDARTALDSPEKLRFIVGAALDKALEEEIDYTLEVRRVYK